MPARSDQFTNRLVFIHGFTQTHHHWHDGAHRIADRLGTTPTLAFVDLPGHGLSADDHTEINGAGEPLVAVAGRGTYVGYSMGGRFGLVAATTGLTEVERLVLIGATPGIDDDTARAERHRLDHERADHLEQVGVDTFLDEWLAAPMFSRLPDDPVDVEHRRRNSTRGLATSLRSAGTGSQTPLWPRLLEIGIPVLVIAGELDEKFSSIGNRLTAALPHATFVSIANAGHAAHIEAPDATADAVAAWLA